MPEPRTPSQQFQSRLAVCVALVVLVVLGALVWGGAINVTQSAQLGCQRTYLSQLSAALAMRARISDQLAHDQELEQETFAVAAPTSAEGIHARVVYISQLKSAQEERAAHPLPSSVTC